MIARWDQNVVVLSLLLTMLCIGGHKIVQAKSRPQVNHNVSVHDPSVIKVGDIYYVFGSHLAAAKSTDLINWYSVADGVQTGNKLIPNVLEEMGEELDWVGSNTFWAPDVIELPDGRFYMYYCIGRLDQPRAVTGLAIAEQIEGPYENQGVIVRSGMRGSDRAPDGRHYDPTVHPNAVDPHVFFDAKGELWMVYGSYSGGIFICKLDPTTGLPYPDQGYGKKLMGGNHSRIEGPYILYSPHTNYYYLFVTYGGLASDGGYNIRVMRSESPDGPYYDAAGNEMLQVAGRRGTLFDDRSIEPFGAKLIGNHEFRLSQEPRSRLSNGYVSPGHNSAYYDEENDKYYLLFHTRFVNRGEYHEVRVHQLFFNEEGWPVIAPHRYAGETSQGFEFDELVGKYQLINHGKAITTEVQLAQLITLQPDHHISGAVQGQWEFVDHYVNLTIDNTTYKGVFLSQWDPNQREWVITFSALSSDGVAIWGSQMAQ